MAHVINVGIQKPLTISSDRDLLDAVREFMGSEFANELAYYMEDVDSEKALAKEKAKTDEEAITKENEMLRNVLDDVKIMLEQWCEMLEGRVTKTKMIRQMVEIEKQIDEVL